jgi:hypothetical protein
VRSRRVLARNPSRSPGRYCIRLSRVFTSAVSWARFRLMRLARDRLRCDQTSSTGLSPCAYGGSRNTVSQSRAAISSVMAVLTWVFRLSLLRHPRFHLHFTPTSSSWLNLVERWFAEIINRKLRRSAHRSVAELETDIRAWTSEWNKNPMPFVWTKTADEILETFAAYYALILQS